MIFLFLLPLYLLAVGYIAWRCLNWMKACHPALSLLGVRVLFVILVIVAATSVLTANLAPSGTSFRRLLKSINNYWIGYMLYTVLFLGCAEIVRLLLKLTRLSKMPFYNSPKTFVIVGALIVVLVLSFGTYGIFHARDIKTRSYQVTVDKDCGDQESLKVALVADLHMGYSVGTDQIRRMVDRINEQKPDLVCIAGDIFDNDYDALDDPERLISILKEIKSTYGVYSCYGNHDVSEKLLMGFTLNFKAEKNIDPRMDEFLEKAGIRSLKDEAVLVEDAFYVIGRLDYSKPGNKEKKRKTIEELTEGLDPEKPVLLIEHQPKELDRLADAGIDLALSGHTHDGQMFPGNLTVKLAWENPCGYMQKGAMHSFVTSGVGVWGPNMRVGTDSEVMVIDVSFSGQKE